jgi:hypothetical protein
MIAPHAQDAVQSAAATDKDTLVALLARARRTNDAAPIARVFVQRSSTPGQPGPGVLADMVRNSDRAGLRAYLLVTSVASRAPWNVDQPAAVWARALGYSPVQMSRIWRRLEGYRLVERGRSERPGRPVSITLLWPDGSGDAYARPFERGAPYFKLPFAFWTDNRQWHRTLSLPEIAVLLIAESLGPDFMLPYHRAPHWYGISPDSAERGLRGLQDHNLLEVRRELKAAPLSPTGLTEERRYSLARPFGP